MEETLFLYGGNPAVKQNYNVTNPAFIPSDEELREYKENAPALVSYSQRYYVKKFEIEFARYFGTDYFGVAVNSGNSALKLALKAIGVSKGDEVLIPAFSFIADLSVVVELCATPVFIDVSKNNYCIDEHLLLDAITENTKALILVNLFGCTSNIETIVKICKDNNIILIEDCAHSLGSEYNKKKLGSFGNIACFSFNQTKLISSEEGGMIITKDECLYESIKTLINNGLEIDTGNPLFFGFSYRMTNFQAFSLLIQFKKIDELVTNHKKISQKYADILKNNKLLFTYEKSFNYLFFPVMLPEQYKDIPIQKIKMLLFLERVPCINTQDIPLPNVYSQLTGIKVKHKFPVTENICNSLIKFYINDSINSDIIMDISKAFDKIQKHYRIR